mgnify:CR=1 FL=1
MAVEIQSIVGVVFPCSSLELDHGDVDVSVNEQVIKSVDRMNAVPEFEHVLVVDSNLQRERNSRIITS